MKFYRNDKPIRGFVHFENAQPIPFTCARMLEDGTVRVVRYIELDGITYVRSNKKFDDDPFEWLNLDD